LQEKRYERVGETQTRVCDVRLLAATNRDLNAAVAAGTFREDLLYRLNVIEIDLPPLRERRADIPVLANHLLRFFSRQSVRPAKTFSAEAMAAIEKYRWPGNVRELRNAIERGVILASNDSVGLSDLPAQIGSLPAGAAVEVGGRATLDQLEAEHIRRTLNSTQTMEEAAAVLGIDPSTLYRKRKRYGL
jgi:NtrC-family two-component system response regulator AlgB